MSGGARSLKDAITFIGECLDMCPEYERFERELHKQLEIFEKIPDTDFVDHGRAVKRYHRSAAGDPEQMPSDVRPPSVLLQTLSYLIIDIMGVHGFDKTYNFLQNRLRSIRSDFQLQNFRGIEAVNAFEIMVRYGIMALHRVCTTQENVNMKLKQEIDQMNAALKTLIEMYTELGRQGFSFQNEPEFRAYFILVHIWSPQVAPQTERETTPAVFFHPFVQHALAIQATVGARPHNKAGFIFQYARFFELVRDVRTTYLMAAVCETHFAYIRLSGLIAGTNAYYVFEGNKETMMEAEKLVELFGYDGVGEVMEDVEFMEIPVFVESGRTFVRLGKQVVDRKPVGLNLKGFKGANLVLRQKLNYRIVESKRIDVDLSEVDVVKGEDRISYKFDDNAQEQQYLASNNTSIKVFHSTATSSSSSSSSWDLVPGVPTFPEPKKNTVPNDLNPPISALPTPVQNIPVFSGHQPQPIPMHSGLNIPKFIFKENVFSTPSQIFSTPVSSKPVISTPQPISIIKTDVVSAPIQSILPLVTTSKPNQANTPFRFPTVPAVLNQHQQPLSPLKEQLLEIEATDILLCLLSEHVQETLIEIHNDVFNEFTPPPPPPRPTSTNLVPWILDYIMAETVDELLNDITFAAVAECLADTFTDLIAAQISSQVVVEVVSETTQITSALQVWRNRLAIRREAKRLQNIVKHMQPTFTNEYKSAGGSEDDWKTWEDVDARRRMLFAPIGLDKLHKRGVWKCVVSTSRATGWSQELGRWIKSVLRRGESLIEKDTVGPDSNLDFVRIEDGEGRFVETLEDVNCIGGRIIVCDIETSKQGALKIGQHLNFQSVTDLAPISKIATLDVTLDVSTTNDNIISVRQNLIHHLLWLAHESPPEPGLQVGIFKDLSESRTNKHFSFAIHRIRRVFPVGDEALDQFFHFHSLMLLIRIFNLKLDAIKAVVTHDELRTLAWPPVEASLIDGCVVMQYWNTLANLQLKASVLERLKINDLALEFSEFEETSKMYENWMESLEKVGITLKWWDSEAWKISSRKIDNEIQKFATEMTS
ncbi:hypothetical protein HK096_001195, partial [Nowakowskiella sp. JEL0078]